MNERLTHLEGQFRAAEALVDASKAELRKASAERLDILLASPAQVRLGALADPALTAFDREQLRRSLEVQLPSRRQVRGDAPRPRTSRARRFMRRHRRGLMATAITFAPMVLLGAKAVLATPPNPIMIRFSTPATIDWTLPDGTHWPEAVAAGDLGVFNARGKVAWLRKWFPQAGYAVTAPLPGEWLDQGVIRRAF